MQHSVNKLNQMHDLIGHGYYNVLSFGMGFQYIATG